MIEIKGTYNTALVFCDELEPGARGQIQTLCDQPFAADSKIRIMPDVHAGVGCTIGTCAVTSSLWLSTGFGYILGSLLYTVLWPGRGKRQDCDRAECALIPLKEETRCIEVYWHCFSPQCCCSAAAPPGSRLCRRKRANRKQTWTERLSTDPMRRVLIWIPQKMSSIWRAAAFGEWNS